MPKIEGFKIKNYGTLKGVTLGRLWNSPKSAKPLTPMTAVIGKNGAGKSTIFDAFGFLSDCLKLGVEEACDSRGRGGFHRIRSQGQLGSIEFEIYYKESNQSRPITYELFIDLDESERPYVKKERLRQRRQGQRYGWPFSFVALDEGKGVAWKGDKEGEQLKEDEAGFNLLNFLEEFKEKKDIEESNETEFVELSDNRRLGIATLGALKQHPRISLFRRFLENWYLSYFTPDAARSLPLAGPQKRLNIHGDNLGNVVQFMEREHRNKFQSILKKISQRIPGIDSVSTTRTPDGRLLLCFNNLGFSDPFYSQQMSDGTLKIFAYLLLLEDPSPPPFICIEEPENGLYHKLLEILVNEFREHAERRGGSQIFVTTHQPYFVNALEPSEVWILEKQEDGFSRVRRASETVLINNLVQEGIPLGSLWYSDYLDE